MKEVDLAGAARAIKEAPILDQGLDPPKKRILVVIVQDASGLEGIPSIGSRDGQMPAFYGGNSPDVQKHLHDFARNLKQREPRKRVFVRTYRAAEEIEVL